jgi:serine/threonine protein kinase
LHSDTDPALVHGDIKPDNALIDQNGRAVWIDTIGSGTAGGSSLDVGLFGRYAAPELYQPEQRAAGQEGHLLGEDIVKTPASDVYAFAMTLYEVRRLQKPK